MKVLVCEKLADIGLELLAKTEGIQVDVRFGLTINALRDIISDYHALIIRSGTELDRSMLLKARQLKVIGRAGIGLDNVDIETATEKGIVVMNTPTGNTITTAEHTLSMMLSLSRNIPKGTLTLKRGMWEKKQLTGHQLSGKTLGIIGFGKIGSIVANRASALKMKIMVHDPLVDDEKISALRFIPVSLSTLYRQADLISLHLPKGPETLKLINKAAFDQMKKGVMIINCSRGGIIDESDLEKAIESGKVRGAALDVFETEPPGKSSLLSRDEVICTPHLGASTVEAQMNVSYAISQQIIDFLKTGACVNAVNMPGADQSYRTEMAPLIELSEKMGILVAQLSKQNMESVNISYFGPFEDTILQWITPSLLKGLLKHRVDGMVNIVNAVSIAEKQKLSVTQNHSSKEKDYHHLIELIVETFDQNISIHGTIMGKSDPRIIKIDTFRLEMNPSGNMAILYNEDRPGSVGEIASTLGSFAVNIEQMQVGQEEGGERNIIFLTTDKPISEYILEKMKVLSTVKDIRVLTF